MTVGKIIMPSSTLAVNRLIPLPPLICKTWVKNGVLTIACTAGTSTIIPKKPYTTDGMPASSCTAGSIKRLMPRDAKRDIYTAVSTPSGTPTRIAPAVTYTEPRIIGKMP